MWLCFDYGSCHWWGRATIQWEESEQRHFNLLKGSTLFLLYVYYILKYAGSANHV